MITRKHSTASILRVLPTALGLPADARSSRIGDEPGYFDRALAYVDQKVADIHDSIVNAPSKGLAWARQEVAQSAADLSTVAHDLYVKGAQTAGDMVNELASRAADSVATWGEGLGTAFENFWGFTPGEGLGWFTAIGTGLAIVAGIGLVYVLATPGGQAYVAAIGSGGSMVKPRRCRNPMALP